jgi:hypothetical protein
LTGQRYRLGIGSQPFIFDGLNDGVEFGEFFLRKLFGNQIILPLFKTIGELKGLALESFLSRPTPMMGGRIPSLRPDPSERSGIAYSS